ncbi:hypothetical protein [Phytoactinopolyspora halotolerans]|uniref:Uncharacterized protein n=1 Tax=Phytoactinopolyspora halotolerans TaxID=1981512 RepID=A0A6L9S8Q6_9ACTN|nr:hypothetical protein [Phytoactinopolyspora halotolerans]NEE01447.1 hypothetical protein [Phytoactinopolyspora halotolerans]
MRFGRLKLAAAAAGVVAVAAVWLLAEAATASLAMAGQTAVIIGAVLFVAAVQHRESRRLAVKIDTFRRRVYQMLGDDRDLLDAPAAVEVPQEHFEQLARLLSANNQRLESAIDDLASRLDGGADVDGSAGTVPAETAPTSVVGAVEPPVPAVGNATRTRL